MFDALIRDVAERFGLGDKARELLAALLAIVFDERHGGIAGLLTRFRQGGLGELFGSWIGNPQPQPIEPQQLESVLGANAISGLADRLHSDRGKALDAAAAMLPPVIGLLTRNGQLPTSVPSAAGGYLRAAAPRLAGATAKNGGPVDSEIYPDLTPGLGWVKWILLLAVMLALGYCVLHRAPATSGLPSISATAPVASAPLS